MIQHYELMYIVPGSVELEQVPAVKARVAELLTATGATMTSELDMDRRRLAYPIGQETYGYYHVVQFDLPNESLLTFDKKLRLETGVLRFIVVKSPVQSVEQLKVFVAGEKYKKQRPVPIASAKTEQTSATALSEAEMVFAKSVSSKHVAEVVAEDKKVSVEELDKKLDAILEDTDLEKKL